MTPSTPAPAEGETTTRWRKKPVEVEASQWFKNGDHPADYAEDEFGYEAGEMVTFTGACRKELGWEGAVVRYYRRPGDSGERACQHCGARMHDHGWIDTLEGGHIVCPGDWIIKGVAGELYPCKPDIFAASYELAARPTPPVAGEVAEVIEVLTKKLHGYRPNDTWREIKVKASYLNSALDLLSRLSAALAGWGDWRPVGSAPKDGTHLLFETGGSSRIPAVGHWDGIGWKTLYGFLPFPTHWMPLPPPPALDSPVSRNGEEG